jgi:hypothetical protein
MTVFSNVARFASQKLTDVSEMLASYETSVNFYETIWRNIPEDSDIHTRRREKLKSHMHNFGGEASCKTSTCKIMKETGGQH